MKKSAALFEIADYFLSHLLFLYLSPTKPLNFVRACSRSGLLKHVWQFSR